MMSFRSADKYRQAMILAVAGLLSCLALSIGMLALRGDQLDADAVLPFQSSPKHEIVSSPAPSTSGPSTEAKVILALLATVCAVPVVVPRNAFRAGLIGTISVIGLFVIVTALRLGLLFVPVLFLEIAAYRRMTTRAESDPAPRPGARSNRGEKRV
jgi:hypothetical protein